MYRTTHWTTSTRPDLNPRDWLVTAGVCRLGVRYAPPDQAKGWGTQGCPLLPRVARETLGEGNLSDELYLEFGETTAAADLDREFLQSHGITELTEETRRIFRDLLYRLESCAGWVAIPAGIPLVWLENLPLSGRTRGAVRRTFLTFGVATFFDEPLMAVEFLKQPEVGMTTLNELICVIESAEIQRGIDETSGEDAFGPDQDQGGIWANDFEDQEVNTSLTADGRIVSRPPTEGTLEHGAQILTGSERRSVDPLIKFAKWAMAETGSATLGEAMTEVTSATWEVNEWNDLSAVALDHLVSRPPHAYEILSYWAAQLHPREKTVFVTRITTAQHPRTLEEIAQEFGVTRERIRQVEKRIRKQFEDFIKSDQALPIVWRATSIRNKVGVAAPEAVVEELLKAPHKTDDYRDLVLELAGPYQREDDGWLIRRTAKGEDPTPEILTQADEVGRIDHQFAHARLREWGLEDSLHNAWLLRHPSIREFNGQLVRWGSSIPDRLAFALADIGQPATLDYLMNYVGEETARNSAVNALGGDPRLIKATQNEWGLASWGLPEYTGTANSIRQLLEEEGGYSTIDQMILKMNQTFNVSENTTRVYCYAPMFVCDGQRVRLRTEEDEPFRCDPASIQKTPGVFDLGDGRLARVLEVDENTLRGSGTMLTEAAGAILRVQVNDYLTFSDENGASIGVTFPETSIIGPSLGSVRNTAIRLGAKIDDCLTLVFDIANMSFKAELTDPTSCGRSWEAVGRLTGVGASIDIGSLAKALHCADSEVRALLRRRGDTQVLECLPHSQPSSSLDNALATLEAQVEQG